MKDILHIYMMQLSSVIQCLCAVIYTYILFLLVCYTVCVLLGHIWSNVTKYIYSSTVPFLMYFGIYVFFYLTLSLLLFLFYIYLDNFV